MKKQIFVVLSLIFLISTISAQSLFMKDFYTGKNSLSFNYNRLLYKGSQAKFFNGVYKLKYMQPVSKDLAIEGQISYINNSSKNYNPFSESGIGNIYLGINKLTESGKSNYSLGVYLPTGGDRVLANPELLNNIYDVGNISNKGIVLRGNYQYRSISKSGLILGIEVGPDIWIATDSNTKDGFEMFIHSAGRIGYNFSKFELFGEIGNRFILTEDLPEFKDRFGTHFGFGGTYKFKNYEIGVSYKNTFDNTLFDTDGSFGISFRMNGF